MRERRGGNCMKRFTQYFLLIIIMAWGFAAFLIVGGDDENTPLTQFVLNKLWGLCNVAVVVYLAKKLSRHDWEVD